MNKLSIILLAALGGCSTFHDPAASDADFQQCRAEAQAARAGASSGWVVTFPVAAVERHALQHSAFDACMAAKGYRTTAKQ